MSFIPLQSVDPVVAWTLASLLIEIEGITYLDLNKVVGNAFNRIRIRCSECGEYVKGRVKTVKIGIELAQCEVCDGIICPARQVSLSRVIYWTGEGPPPPVKKRQVATSALHEVLQAAKVEAPKPPAPAAPLAPAKPPARMQEPAPIRRFTKDFGK